MNYVLKKNMKTIPNKNIVPQGIFSCTNFQFKRAGLVFHGPDEIIVFKKIILINELLGTYLFQKLDCLQERRRVVLR